MKRGVIIIGRDEEYGVFQKEIGEYKLHAEAMKQYCYAKGIETSIPKNNLNGYLWGKALAKHGDFVFQIENYVILYIPSVITNYQLEQFEVIVKEYLKRIVCAFSYSKRDNSEIDLVIEEENRNVTLEMIYEEIQEKNTYFNMMEGEKDVQNITHK